MKRVLSADAKQNPCRHPNGCVLKKVKRLYVWLKDCCRSITGSSPCFFSRSYKNLRPVCVHTVIESFYESCKKKRDFFCGFFFFPQKKLYLHTNYLYMRKGAIDNLDNFANKLLSFYSDNAMWFYIAGSIAIFFVFVIPRIISFGFNIFYIVPMLFVSAILGWAMMLLYLLPIGLIQLFCYFVRNPLKSILILLKFVLCFLVLFFLGMCIHAL